MSEMRGEHGPELDLSQTGGVVRTVRPFVVGEHGPEPYQLRTARFIEPVGEVLRREREEDGDGDG